MPIPKPNENENKDDFVGRCMIDETMVSEYDEDQRYAICLGVFDEERAVGDIDLTPTKEMVANAKEGLELRKEFGRGGTEIGVGSAKAIINNEITEERVKRIFSYLSRHEVDKKGQGFNKGEEGYPSAGLIAWKLWSGDAGFKWSERKVKELKDMEENKEVILDEKRHIQKIEETEDSIIVYYGKSIKDVPMEDEMPEEMPEENEHIEGHEEEEEVETIYKRSNPNAEIRTFNIQDLDLRQEGDDNVVVGYGSVFNSLSNELGGFREIIAPTAFEGRLNDDVRFLFNHDPNMLLARSTNGTLKMSVDEVGLKYEAHIPDTSTGRDVLTLLRNNTLNQNSFAFVVEDDSWEVRDGVNIRTINKVSMLADISLVSYPAYNEAKTIALRSMDEWQKDEEKKVMKENLKKEKEEREKEELDLTKRSLAELRLSIINKKSN
tara:strand:- start:8503 stop:9810 length:1308 start_codon:yes stop_codon:yes gene_type:complete